jgi:hypothetical protein
MTTTAAALTRSLGRAWERTAGVLWRPFDAKVWFVLAFAQFLAALPPESWGGGVKESGRDWSRVGNDIDTAWERLAVGGLVLFLVALGLILLLLLVLVLTWVSSRAKLVFLDDVVHRRAQIVEPWRRFRREGNSLFLCRLAVLFAACVLVATALLTIASAVGIGALLRGQPLPITALVVVVGSVVAILSVALGYAAFFLEAFVVPIMHRYRLGAVDAWRRFFGLFRNRPLPFLVAGLVVLSAFVVFGTWTLVFGFMTCCVGFLLLMTPYLSNVLLLPVTVLYRSFTLEFLAQFDDELLPTSSSPGSPLPAAELRA